MKYNGIKLIEMTTSQWNGKTREMLVWGFDEIRPTMAKVIGYEEYYWIDNCGKVWLHCAEIPNEASVSVEEKEDAMKIMIDNENKLLELKKENEKLKTEVNELKNSCSYQTYCTVRDVKEKLKDKVSNLEKENEKLKAKIKSLRVERGEMANAVSSAVWKELMDRAKNVEGPVNTTMAGFGFNDISDVVLNKILEYKPEDTSKKKTRRMTNRELATLLSTGKAEKCYPYNVNGRDLTKVYRTHSYYRNNEDSPCAKSILIRYNGTNKWVKPLVEE